uniref:Uncharacterized protein n=1 Tax=Oryza sativa subsp. japonica TaxID=39947 RepID=Q6EQU2_ORYSJ|nr:hypothetical protein [Oryza sativa Japonica Group]
MASLAGALPDLGSYVDLVVLEEQEEVPDIAYEEKEEEEDEIQDEPMPEAAPAPEHTASGPVAGDQMDDDAQSGDT